MRFPCSLIVSRATFTSTTRCFSSFPHGTCSLSVSRKYLALDGHYHPFCAAVPSNTTLGKPSYKAGCQIMNGALTLSSMLFQQQLVPDPTKERLPYATIQEPRSLIFGLSFFLLPSPVLKESLLVSCPPLNNMLKFSGCSFLRSALKMLLKLCSYVVLRFLLKNEFQLKRVNKNNSTRKL